MNTQVIYLTNVDMERLKSLIEIMKFDKQGEPYLQKLEEKLQRARIVKSKDIPKDVITMNSKASIQELKTKEKITYTLIYPNNVDIEQDRISILAPIGTALLGRKVGDLIEWSVPAGLRKFKIVKILYQPEAAGDYKR